MSSIAHLFRPLGSLEQPPMLNSIMSNYLVTIRLPLFLSLMFELYTNQPPHLVYDFSYEQERLTVFSIVELPHP